MAAGQFWGILSMNINNEAMSKILTSVILLPKIHSPSPIEKEITDKPQLRDILFALGL